MPFVVLEVSDTFDIGRDIAEHGVHQLVCAETLAVAVSGLALSRNETHAAALALMPRRTARRALQNLTGVLPYRRLNAVCGDDGEVWSDGDLITIADGQIDGALMPEEITGQAS